MEFTNLNFLSFFIFIIAIISIIYFWFTKYKNQEKFNKKYTLLASEKNNYIKYIFLFLSVFIILFWIFWLKYWEKKVANEAKWIDIIFTLDVSKSMNVADISDSRYNYTRLDVIKEAISNFVVKNKQDRFWLVIFAWDAISTIPLTTDHNLFLTLLKWVDYRNLVKQWSDFEKAIDLSLKRFVWDDTRSKALIFISDWWDEIDNVDTNYLKSIAKNNNVNYFVVGVWTENWWRIIKSRDAFGRLVYQKYKWQYVISKLNRKNLEEIATSLNWEYIEVKKIWDLLTLNKWISKIQKQVLKRNINWELADFGRSLTIFSFIFFIIFLILYLAENKFIFNKKQ